MKECICTVYGLMQGVAYRAFAQATARERGIVGEVRNMSDGTVHVIAQGSVDVLNAFIDDLKRGPGHAKVERVEVDWHDPSVHYDDFFVTYHE